MKKRLLCLAAGVLALFVFSGAAFAAFQEVPFDGKPYYLEGDMWVLDEGQVKLVPTMDPFTVRLIGLRNSATGVNERLWFEVVPPKLTAAEASSLSERQKQIRTATYVVPVSENIYGKNFSMEARNFVTGDREQVFLVFDSPYTSLRHFAVVELRADDVRRDSVLLFDSRVIERAIFTGEFKGRYIATVWVEDTKSDAVFDLSGKRAFYQREGVFDSHGNIHRPIAIYGKSYREITLGQRDANGVYELNGMVDLYGVDDSDLIAVLNCTLRYNPTVGMWLITKSEFTPGPGIKFAEIRQPKN